MQFPLNEYQMRRARLSRPALLAVSILHIAFLWLLLQTAPVKRVVRETVVMLNLPITQPLPKPPPKKIITLPKPPEPIKPIEKPVVVKKTITKVVEPLPVPPKPPEPPKPVVLPKPPEKVVDVKPVEVQAPKEVVQETPKVIPQEVVKEVPKETPKPVVAEVAAELPPTPTPGPAPVIPAAAAAAAAPSPTAPAAAAQAAEPAKASVPSSSSAVSAPAAPASAPAVAPSTGGSNRAISTTNAVPGAGAAGTAAPAGSGAPSLSGALANPLGFGASNGAPGAGGGSIYQGGRRGGWAAGELQRASSTQLNPNKRPENYEIEFEKAKKDDCLHPTNPSLRNGLRMLNGDCPK
jgi:hypothetical protein